MFTTDKLNRNRIKKLLAWGEHLSYSEYNWKKTDTKLYMILKIILQDETRHIYEERKHKNLKE